MKNSVGRLTPFIGSALTLCLLLPLSVNRDGPYIQITGHYAPLATGTAAQRVAIGTDSESDLRLTESGVAGLHGWIETQSDGTLRYVHSSPIRGTEYIQGNRFPKAHWSSFGRLQSGDTVEVTDPGKAPRTTKIDLADGRWVELWSGDGVRRKTLLPLTNGRGVPLAEMNGTVPAWLLQCDGRLAFGAKDSCGGAVSLGPMASVWFALGSPVTVPSKAAVPSWLRDGRIRKARKVDNAFAIFDGRDIAAIPEVNGIDLLQGADHGFVLYRTGRKNPLPRVARVGDPHRTVRLQSGSDSRDVGETALADGDTLSIGDSYFRVHTVPAGATPRVELTVQEKYDRFHLFYSLSAGRLNFTDRTRLIPGAGATPLLVQGRTGERAIFSLPSDEGLPAQSETTWKLPLPRWAASDAGVTAGEAALVPLARFRAQGSGTSMQLSAAPLQTFPWSSLASDGGTLNAPPSDRTSRFAGHIVTFRRTPPLYEQIALPILMAAALAVLGWIAVGGVLQATQWPEAEASTTTFRPLLRTFAITAIICVWILLIVGVLLMARMAAVDSLVGKSDYYHRQLFYSYLTAALIASILAGTASRGRPKSLENARWMGWPLSLRVLVISAALLFAWQVVDALLFRVFVGAIAPVPSITVQLIAGNVLLAAFIIGGVVTVLSNDTTSSRIVLSVLIALLAIGIAEMVRVDRWVLAALGGAIAAMWVVLHPIRSAPEPPRMGETQLTFARLGSSGLMKAKARLISGWRAASSWIKYTRRDILERWPKVESGSTFLIFLGLVILGVGSVFYRGRGGLGVKPAEFAVWFLAPGFCMLLATNFSRRAADPAKPSSWVSRMRQKLDGRGRSIVSLFAGGATLFLLVLYGRVVSVGFVAAAVLPPIALLMVGQWGRNAPAEGESPLLDFRRSFRIYEPVLLTVIMIELLVIVLYVLQGDFGPLLVLVPTVIFVTVLWAGSPEPTPVIEAATEETADEPAQPAPEVPLWRRRVWLRRGVSVLFFVACAWLFFLGRAMVDTYWAAELPVGQSVARASKRFLTASAPWFTKEGSWSVDSLWIANGYYDRERMLANLHSDLAFVALIQSFEIWAAVVVLAVYFILIWFCLAGLGVETSRWSGGHDDATVRLSTRRATLLLYFAASYLLAELAVHIGSAFNAMPQTGVTLPWISSGGSASLGFGGLCAIAIAIAINSLRPVAMQRRARRESS